MSLILCLLSNQATDHSTWNGTLWQPSSQASPHGVPRPPPHSMPRPPRTVRGGLGTLCGEAWAHCAGRPGHTVRGGLGTLYGEAWTHCAGRPGHTVRGGTVCPGLPVQCAQASLHSVLTHVQIVFVVIRLCSHCPTLNAPPLSLPLSLLLFPPSLSSPPPHPYRLRVQASRIARTHPHQHNMARSTKCSPFPSPRP